MNPQTIVLKILIVFAGIVALAVIKSQFNGGVIEAGIICALTLWAANAVNLQAHSKKTQTNPALADDDEHEIGVIDNEVLDTSDSLPESKTKRRIDKTYPWRRFFARMIDYQISAL